MRVLDLESIRIKIAEITAKKKNNKKSAFLQILCVEAGGVESHSAVSRANCLSGKDQKPSDFSLRRTLRNLIIT